MFTILTHTVIFLITLWCGTKGGYQDGVKWAKEHPVVVEKYYTYEALPEFHSDGTTIADQGNNPGCLTAGYEKYDSLAIGYIRGTGTYRFLVFPDSATGWYALKLRIQQDSTESLYAFLHTYCRNIPRSYIDAVMTALNAKSTDSVSDHLDKIDIIARTIAKQEGWSRGKVYQRRVISKH